MSPAQVRRTTARRCARPWLGLALAWLAARAAAAPLPAVQWSATEVRAGAVHIAILHPAPYRQTFDASARVQSADGWLPLWNMLAAAQARLRAAQASLQLARLQAQRAQGLFDAGQDVALATVQQARAAVQQAQAQAQAAQAAQQTAQAEWRARLGAALATRLQRDAALRRALADGSEWTAALTLPPERALPRAAQVWLRAPAAADSATATWLAAPLIGTAPRASNRLQGLRFVVAVPATRGLQPGLQLDARVDAATAQQGVWLPAASVVWAEGRAVCFVAHPAAHGAYRFTARDVSTAWATDGGYVQPGWGAVQVVTHGAGLLLTPPPHAQPAADGDDD
ncbi:MAG: TolC family protein [Thiomonas sp.]